MQKSATSYNWPISPFPLKLQVGGFVMARTITEKRILYTRSGVYKRKIEELENTEERVAHLLNKYPDARNSDKILIWKYWQDIDKLEGMPDEDEILDLTSPETITRCRRVLQNDCCLFLPDDPEIIEKRAIASEAVNEWASQAIALRNNLHS